MRLRDGLTPVLRSTPGGPPLPILVEERKGERGAERKNAGNPHAIVAREQYVPNETFLIRLLVVAHKA
jgi:hypothetical protein